MAESEQEKDPKEVIIRVGKQLAASKKCPSKDALVKLLKQATSALPELKQSELLKSVVKPLSDSLIRHGLLHSEDKDVSLLVSICLCEIIRVLAPNPDFSETVIRDVFGLFLRMFSELGAVKSPYFLRRAELLKIVAKLKFCLQMLDTGCDDLVLKMFKIFFSVERGDHDPSLISSMASIITCILEEKLKELDSDVLLLEGNTLQQLLDVVLQNLIKEKKDTEARGLAVTVIMNCGEKLELYICQFLTSCILNRDTVASVAKDNYHEIMLKIFQHAPEMLLSVMPNMTHELLTDQVDVRMKALNLIKKLLPLCGKKITYEYPHLFTELLNRISDKSAEVRITALSCAKAYCMINHSGRESSECLSAIRGRLLDHDEKVRTGAVNVVCELAKTNFNFASPDLISLAADRLRDKKVVVRSNALKGLVELYQVYCTSHAVHSSLEVKEHIEEIPCKLLLLCYEKDCQDFRPQNMELKLADLFPASLSVEERTRHWIYMFSIFTPPHFKALRIILSQKRRLRDGLENYLTLRNRTEENSFGETERKMEALIQKMSCCFPDPAKAKRCFQKLNELEDNGSISVLQQFLNKENTLGSDTTKEESLRRLGDRSTFSEFFNQLAKKCSFNIFSHEHVQCILGYLSDDGDANKNLKKHSVQLLLTIIGAFPFLLNGFEKQFELLLLEKKIPFDDHLLEILAREGCQVPIKLSNIYATLERICLEGSRAQSKLAVSAIAALAETPEHYIFSNLCKRLVDSLLNGQNIPTLLQSLGCLAQYSISTFEAQEEVITSYIIEEVFQQDDVLLPNDLDSLDQTYDCCSSCRLKVFGLKTLVRSFLPHKCTSRTRPIRFLLDIIQKLLEKGGCSGANTSWEHNKAYMRLAAAKSVLRLSRKWDLHIPPQIFHLTVLMAKDPSAEVRRSFVSKVYKFLKARALPCRYACAFPFVVFDSVKDLREDALKYLEEITREFGIGTKIHENMVMQGAANHPVYLVVFLIHVLAHDTMFPSPDCEDEKVYAQFLSPLFITLEVLVKENLASRKTFDSSLYLRSILIAIKKATDAVNYQMTRKLHLLAEVGISILNSLDLKPKTAPCSPGQILLPSSLYKSGLDATKEADTSPLIGYRKDASFIEKLISILRTEIGSCALYGELSFQIPVGLSGISNKGSNPKSTRANNLLVNKSTEPIDELHTGQKEQATRTSHREVDIYGGLDQIISLHNEFSTEKEQVTDGSRISEKKRPPPLEPSTSKSLEFQKNVAVSSSKEDVVSRCNNVCIEPSNSSRVSEHVNRSSPKKIKTNGEALVGKHIKLWSPGDNCYHSGFVDTFDSMESTHKITYDSGEVNILSLDSEKWEIDLDSLPTSCVVQCSDSPTKGQRVIPDAFECDSDHDNMPNTKELFVRKAPPDVKRNKKRRKAVETCTSKVSDLDTNAVARRTRSQRQKT